MLEALPVTFLNPGLLWLLPLAFLPILWHWRNRLKAGRLELPSLFLLRRALKKRRGRPAPTWLEALLEVLFLLAILLAFAHPMHRHFGPSVRRLVVFADVSPSLTGAHPAWKGELRRALRAWTESRAEAELAWSDWSHVRENLPPTPIDAGESLERVLGAAISDNGAPTFEEALAHFGGWKSEYLGESTAILFVSDFNLARFKGEGPLPADHFLALKLGERAPANALLPAPPRAGISFAGENATLSFRLQRRGEKSEVTVRLVDAGGTTRYVTAQTLTGDQPVETTLAFPQTKAGIFPLEFRLEEDGRETSRAWSLLRVQAPFPLALLPNDGSAAGRFLQAVFRHDIGRGNLIPDAGAETAVIASWRRPEELAAHRGRPTTLFLPPGLAPADVEEGLSRWLGAPVKVRKEKRSSGERPAASVRRPDGARLPQELAALASLSGWEELRFTAWYQLEPGGDCRTLLELDDGSPFLIRSRSAWIFAVGVDPASSGLARSPLAVPLLSLPVFASRPLPPAEFVLAEGAAAAGSPLLEDRRERLRNPVGVFSNVRGFTVINADPRELVGPAADLAAKFPRMKRVGADELGRGELARAWPGGRQILLLLALASLGGLLWISWKKRALEA
ncbi:MAG: hypothetical protein J0L75_08545 [Spirochaetes bacterium]|nr:hypothetical protein [Spirochaetota bacterium]